MMITANPAANTRWRTWLRRWLARNITWRGGLGAIFAGAAIAGGAHISHTDPGAYRLALYYGISAMAVGVVVLAVAGALAYARYHADRIIVVEPNPANLEQLIAFQSIVDRVIGLTPDRAEQLDAIYGDVWSAAMDDACERAYDAAIGSGRLVPHADDRPGSLWSALGLLFARLTGSAGVAVAILVRDLIDEADYTLLTSWWVAAGEHSDATCHSHLNPLAASEGTASSS